MNLHYSQTQLSPGYYLICLIPLWIYTTLKRVIVNACQVAVLYLYEFTLLSNGEVITKTVGAVLYPYEFTLLSNCAVCNAVLAVVLYLYEFTLLSNASSVFFANHCVLYLYEFTLLSNACSAVNIISPSYTSMNLHYSQTCICIYNNI